MAHVQKRCRCGQVLEASERTCPRSSTQSHGPTVLSWVARHVDSGGVERSRRFPRRIDADRYLTSVESARARGLYIDPAFGRQRLEPWCWSWFEARQGKLKASTAAGYRSLIRTHIAPALGRRRLGELRHSDVQTWVDSMVSAGVSASRIRQAVVVLSKALDAARRDNLIATNPARGVDRPTIDRREARFLEPAVVAAIVEAAPAPYDLAIRMLGTLGLRFGELAALRRDDVDVLRRRLRIDESMTEVGGQLVLGSTKTHTERTVPLAPSIAEALGAHLGDIPDDPSVFVFTMPGGGPLGYSNFRRRVWLPALAAAGVQKVGVHALRHSAAAALISGGSSPKDVQTVLGHRSAGFTLTVYGHLFESDLDAIGDRMEAALAHAQTGTRRAGGSGGVVLEHPTAR